MTTHETAHTPPAAEAPGPALTVQGITFPLPLTPRYSEGHVLTLVEASVLNQTFAENLRNNWAGRMKAHLDKVAKDVPTESLDASIIEQLRTDFVEYAGTYTFGFRQPRIVLDPIEHLARKLAKETILSALRERKIDVKTISAEKMEEYVTSLLGKRPDLRKEAKRRIDATKKVSSDIFAELDLPEAASEPAVDSGEASQG